MDAPYGSLRMSRWVGRPLNTLASDGGMMLRLLSSRRVWRFRARPEAGKQRCARGPAPPCQEMLACSGRSRSLGCAGLRASGPVSRSKNLGRGRGWSHLVYCERTGQDVYLQFFKFFSLSHAHLPHLLPED